MRAWILCVSLGLLSAGVQAECNLEKAAKNEAINATLGVKGRCDTDKLVEQKTKDAKKEVKEVKKNTAEAIDNKTDGLKETRDDIKQTSKDVKKVVKDPVKSAATAVVNKG
ncbi:hypothetical protein [Aeromonas enteropelogenes]|uniref:hypothetical protein n=1 Tax=Aeromonas enteropelogenes TaxID=29489 RepID=UPI003BA1FBB0